MSLALATEAYQATMEHLRVARENDAPDAVVDELEGDLLAAEKAMADEWMRAKGMAW